MGLLSSRTPLPFGDRWTFCCRNSVLSVEAELSISIYGLGREAEFGLVVSLTQ